MVEFTEEERKVYRELQVDMYKWDIAADHNREVKESFELGLEQGMVEGITKGRDKERFIHVKRLVKLDFCEEIIMNVTQLTRTHIENIKNGSANYYCDDSNIIYDPEVTERIESMKDKAYNLGYRQGGDETYDDAYKKGLMGIRKLIAAKLIEEKVDKEAIMKCCFLSLEQIEYISKYEIKKM